MYGGDMKKFTILISLLALLLIMVACSETTTTAPSTSAPTTSAPTTAAPTTSTAKPTTAPTTPAAPTGEKYGGILRIGQSAGAVGTIGYVPEMANSTSVVMLPVYEMLLQERNDGTIQGVLATSWKVAPDGKSVTLGLRKGVKFHDGSDFNAEVCKWNLDLQLPYKKSDTKTWTSIDIIDDYTIRINLTEYTNTLWSGLGKMTITAMMSKAAYDKNGLEWMKENPVGTGPFVFAEHERDVKLVFKRNPNYWDTGKPYLDSVEIVTISDATVRRLAFEQGEIVSYSPTTPAITKELEASGKYDIELRPSGPRVLAPDSMNPKSPFADIRVRYAASYALDRETLAEALGSGHSIPPYQLLQGFNDVVIKDLVKTKYDPAKAKQLLTEAGYPSGFKSTLTGRPRIITDDQVSAVAAMLRDAGINVTIDTVTNAKYDSMRIGGTWDGLLAESMLVLSNKNFTFVTYFAGLQWQYTKRPAGLQQGIDASLATPEADPEHIKAIIQLLYDDMTVIPFYDELTVSFQNKGYHQDYDPLNYGGVNLPLYADVWLDKSLR
jgi:peptide/nickel transport system substrate-binding protein